MEELPQDVRENAREWAATDLLSVAGFVAQAVVDETEYEPQGDDEPEIDEWLYRDGTLIAEKEPERGTCPAVTSTISFDAEEVR